MSDKIHAVCPNCQSINALIPGKASPKCGKCGTELLPSHPIHLTDATFERFIAKSALPVLVDFWAPWCGPCKMMGPAFDRVAGSFLGEIILAKLDTEAHQATAGRYGIQSVPTMAMFKQGRETARMAGALNATQIETWIRQHR